MADLTSLPFLDRRPPSRYLCFLKRWFSCFEALTSANSDQRIVNAQLRQFQGYGFQYERL